MAKSVEVFAGTDSSGNVNLWVTDGTAAGTSEIKAASNSAGGLHPGGPLVLNGEVLFEGTDASGNVNFWVTDGTAGGTSELVVTGASSSGLAPHDVTPFGANTVLFKGTDSTGLAGLWISDGTAGGTSEISVSGASSSGIFSPPFFFPDFTVLGTMALFAGVDSGGHNNLWVTDGTSLGTSELSVAAANSSFFNPGKMQVLGNHVLFVANDSGGTPNLFVSDGTSAGSSELSVTGRDLSGLFTNFANPDFTVLGTDALFVGYDSRGDANLWVTDGTSGGTSELSVAGAFSAGLFAPQGFFADFTPLGGNLLFRGYDSSHNLNLWTTDGTAKGTSELSVSGVASCGLNPANLTVFGSEVLFSGTDASGNDNLWITDGTAAGTSEIKAVSNSAGGLNPSNFSAFSDVMLFDGIDAGGRPSLWVTDGAPEGTSELSVAGASSSGLSPFDFSPEISAPCFLAGTGIATPDGVVAVEDLHAGNCALTAEGEAKPIVWIGQRRIDSTRHPRPDLVWPVRIRAGAFGEGEPRRDLSLSPDHSVFRDGVLIPIKYLVNGATIAQERVDAVHYFHVELDRHDILLAEGLPTESYLDTGNRAQFANGGDHIVLHPNFAPLSWDNACAALVTSGPSLRRVRTLLVARARELGCHIVADPDLRVRVDARILRPDRIKGKLHKFLLPARTREIHILSGAGVPAVLDCASEDCRQLGIRIAGIIVDGKPIPLESPLLAEGFGPIERKGAEAWRWTLGAGRLRLADVSTCPVVLELLVCDTMRSWIAPELQAARLAC